MSSICHSDGAKRAKNDGNGFLAFQEIYGEVAQNFQRQESLDPPGLLAPYPALNLPPPPSQTASHLALALAVHQEAIFLFLLLGKGFVLLFVQEAVQGQAAHVLPIGTAGKVEFAAFMHIRLGHREDSSKPLPNAVHHAELHIW
jgi:hypothetical protein